MTTLRRHLAAVDRAARTMARRLPWHVELDDLRSEGLIGLAHALRRRAADGARFEAYAAICARGAMKDYLRACDPATRTERELANRASAAVAALEHHLGRAPTLDEVAEHIDVPVEHLHRLYASLPNRRPIALLYDVDDAIATASSPEELLDRAQTRRTLEASVALLPERTRRLLDLYYQHDLPMSEVARELGLTESRVSQIHKAAIAELRATLSAETRAA